MLRGAGHHKTPENWLSPPHETFAWGKLDRLEVWDARPFVFLDKMMRPYLLSRLKNEAGSWEYIRFLAEANAVYGLTNPDLLKCLQRPDENEYPKHKDDEDQSPLDGSGESPDGNSPISKSTYISTREEAVAAVRERNFEPAIHYYKKQTEERPNYHSAWQRLGFAQRERGVDLMDTDHEGATCLLGESIQSFTHATNHTDQQYAAEAYYNRSKSRWRLGRLTGEEQQMKEAIKDASEAAKRFYDHRFVSWNEFLKENCQ